MNTQLKIFTGDVFLAAVVSALSRKNAVAAFIALSFATAAAVTYWKDKGKRSEKPGCAEGES